MSSNSGRRLDRLLPALSAQERVRLMLRDFKASKPQDRSLLNTAPERQTPEINRLIGLMNAANGDLAHVILLLRERVQQEDLRFAFLEWARLCALEMWAVRERFDACARVPITESEYRPREEEARRELLPVDACATVLVERHEWDDADCETDEDGDQRATDAAWYRLRDEKAKELRALVAAGTLAGTGKGKGLRIECGSFYDWLGQPAPVVPEVGAAFDVRPDAREQEVRRDRRDHEFIRKLLDGGACALDLPLDMKVPLPARTPGRFGPELARLLAGRIRLGVQDAWRELRTVEDQVEEISEAFGGEDPLHPQVRPAFDEARAALVELHEKVQKYTGPFELPEPDEGMRATIQGIVDCEVRHVPLR